VQGGEVLDEAVFSWLPWFWYDAEGGGLKSSQEEFGFFKGKWANVAPILELDLYQLVEFSDKLIDRWLVGRGEGVTDRLDACIKPKLEAMGYD